MLNHCLGSFDTAQDKYARDKWLLNQTVKLYYIKNSPKLQLVTAFLQIQQRLVLNFLGFILG